MNFGRVAAGGVRARVLAEEDDEEGARGERLCGRAARIHKLSAHLRIADDVYYKDHPSLPTSDPSGWRAGRRTHATKAARDEDAVAAFTALVRRFRV